MFILDIGTTTRNALYHASSESPNPFVVYKDVIHNNKRSESNGCLMRITPLAVWCHKLSDADLFAAVDFETRLTHCNPIAIEACQLYCLGVKYLLKGESRQKVYEIVKGAAHHTASWFKEIDNNNLPVATSKIGWVKIAFCYSFSYLKNEVSYDRAMTEMLMAGGDTDTNAAIAGGLLGAYVGSQGIP